MTNSLLFSCLDIEISLTLALVALLHLFSASFLFFKVLFVSVLAFCLLIQPLTVLNNTINLYFMSVHQLLNYFLARSNGGMRERYGKSEQMLEKKNNFIFPLLLLPSVAHYCTRSERMAVISLSLCLSAARFMIQTVALFYRANASESLIK